MGVQLAGEIVLLWVLRYRKRWRIIEAHQPEKHMNAINLIKRAIKAANKAGEFTAFRVVGDDVGGSVAIYNGATLICVIAGNKSAGWNAINSAVCAR